MNAGLWVAAAFWACGAVAVAAGVLVFVVDSMARATYSLATSFVAVGGALLLMDQAYLGVIVILMMVMEMAVMAVYMVMFMGMNPALMPMSMVHSHRASITVAVATFGVLGAGALLVPWPTAEGDTPGSRATGVTEALGRAIMESHMLVMMVVGGVILATIVVGVVLSSSRSRYDRMGDDLDQPAADPPAASRSAWRRESS